MTLAKRRNYNGPRGRRAGNTGFEVRLEYDRPSGWMDFTARSDASGFAGDLSSVYAGYDESPALNKPFPR